jgi:hypothetical protein
MLSELWLDQIAASIWASWAARISSNAGRRSTPEGADVAGEVGQGREAFGVGAEYRDAKQLHALFVLRGSDEDHDPVVARRGLLVGQSRSAQSLQHLFHEQPGTGAA